ncbi:MAG: hypothetical protein HFI82_12120 [Eubacterium sp.]|nr:hypothetical protein [Eubacterium sp.]
METIQEAATIRAVEITQEAATTREKTKIRETAVIRGPGTTREDPENREVVKIRRKTRNRLKKTRCLRWTDLLIK